MLTGIFFQSIPSFFVDSDFEESGRHNAITLSDRREEDGFHVGGRPSVRKSNLLKMMNRLNTHGTGRWLGENEVLGEDHSGNTFYKSLGQRCQTDPPSVRFVEVRKWDRTVKNRERI